MSEATNFEAERRRLFAAGLDHIASWCRVNEVTPPRVEESDEPGKFGACAFYRDGVIKISIPRCAHIGRVGRLWSYPGYVVDRTPYGVLAHELGHHVDQAHGARGGLVASTWRRETGEPAITGYAENDNEWFAEIFRLYVTNPGLLLQLRPLMYVRLIQRWTRHVELRSWMEILAPSTRHLNAARNKVAKAEKQQRLAV